MTGVILCPACEAGRGDECNEMATCLDLRDVEDRWCRRHARYMDGIGAALREHRAYRESGEPACSDAMAIRALTLRLRRAESALGQIGLACRTMRRLCNLDDLPEVRELLEEIETQMEER